MFVILRENAHKSLIAKMLMGGGKFFSNIRNFVVNEKILFFAFFLAKFVLQ